MGSKTRRLKYNKRARLKNLRRRTSEMNAKKKSNGVILNEIQNCTAEQGQLIELPISKEQIHFPQTENSENSPRKILKAKRLLTSTPLKNFDCKKPSSPLSHEMEVEACTSTSENTVGHRIVDVHNFFEELINISNHDSLFQCGLQTMEIKSEKKKALESEFVIACSLCKKEFNIKNSQQKLNKLAVSGTTAAGCGRVQLNKTCASLDLPTMSKHTYQSCQDEVYDEWEVTAWEEMKRAGEREREAALKEGRVDKDGIPIIDVVIDGCWCKRSYRTNYSALSGAASIIGRRFGQVLFMAVKNKYCCICARAEKRNEVVKQHECYKNFSDSSTAMESTIIAEGFNQSIEMHGLIYARFIADGDSSTHSKLLQTRPYPSMTIEKIGCKNHILRNFCTKLQLLKTDTKYRIQERKEITNSKILRGRKYICDAIEYYNSSKKPKSDNITNLHKDISNAMHHGFGYHDKCNTLFCKEITLDKDNKQFLNSQLFQKISFLVRLVAGQARSLIENVDSNVVERFNGVIAKFIGGKRINYASKRSYQARCAGAVVSFNSGKLLTTVHKNIYNESPHSQLKKYEADEVAKREYNRSIIRKKSRKIIAKKINFDYGEHATRPDMDPESFALARDTFLKSLQKTTAERQEIEKRTILQSECGEWLELRRNLLTASNFGKIVKRKKVNTCVNYVKNMLYKINLDHVSSISHGKNNEKAAIDQLSNLLALNIQQCGLFIDEKYPFLGATPDGITDDMVIEIKCPLAPFKVGIDVAIQEGKMHFWKINKKTGIIYVNTNSDWFFQAQGQMHICKKEKCLLAVWYGENKLKTEIIIKDDKFWNDIMEPKLLSFYFDCLLPELVDPRHTRNLPIRDPVYVITKKAKKGLDKENEDNNSTTENFHQTLNVGDKEETRDITLDFGEY